MDVTAPLSIQRLTLFVALARIIVANYSYRIIDQDKERQAQVNYSDDTLGKAWQSRDNNSNYAYCNGKG